MYARPFSLCLCVGFGDCVQLWDILFFWHLSYSDMCATLGHCRLCSFHSNSTVLRELASISHDSYGFFYYPSFNLISTVMRKGICGDVYVFIQHSCLSTRWLVRLTARSSVSKQIICPNNVRLCRNQGKHIGIHQIQHIRLIWIKLQVFLQFSLHF